MNLFKPAVELKNQGPRQFRSTMFTCPDMLFIGLDIFYYYLKYY